MVDTLGMIGILETIKDFANCSVQNMFNSGEGWGWDNLIAEMLPVSTELEEANELLGGTNCYEDDETK